MITKLASAALALVSGTLLYTHITIPVPKEIFPVTPPLKTILRRKDRWQITSGGRIYGWKSMERSPCMHICRASSR